MGILCYFNTAPGEPDCRPDEILCDNICHPRSILCNGNYECRDGSDEANCPTPTTTTPQPPQVIDFISSNRKIEYKIFWFICSKRAQNTPVRMVVVASV